jgi:formate-dependent nitrite reductase cytochrome c552 subunit
LCGACYIDGGFDYVRVGYDQKIGSPEQLVMEVNADKGQLYHDWNNGENAFGMILPKIQNKRKEKRSMNKKVIPELQEHGRKKRKFIK